MTTSRCPLVARMASTVPLLESFQRACYLIARLAHPTFGQEALVNTRTLAIIALVLVVIVILILVL